MSAVLIVNPSENVRIRPYSRIDFLGPILKKTTFNIMAENMVPDAGISHDQMLLDPPSDRLRVLPSQNDKFSNVAGGPYPLKRMETVFKNALSGEKSVPDFFQTEESAISVRSGDEKNERQVLYSPPAPRLMKGLYGDRGSFRVRMRVLVSPDGTVKSCEPLMTSGIPEIDIMAAKYAKSRIYEPKQGASVSDEWCQTEVVLKIGEK